jgi:hypothetical protein
MPVRTYQDAVEYLTDTFDHDRSSRQRRNMRRAVEEAYRELPQVASWSYYRRTAIVNTVASQSTGTIEYTHSSRTVTLTGSTFPTTAAAYRLIISDTHYDIESYTDSTHVVLSANSNPGADVAASTEYQLYKNEYLLPVGFRRLLGIWDMSQNRPVTVVDARSEHALRLGDDGTPGTPHGVVVKNTGETTGRMSLVFTPPPNSAASYDLLYEATPRPFVLPEKHSTGTISISSGATAVTGSGTAFPANCAGCVLRVTTNTLQEPTGPYGALIDGEDVDNPYSFQSVVLSRGSTTALTLVDSADQAYTDAKYSLSDPLDIEDNAMYTALLHLSAAKYAQMMSYKDFPDRMAMAMQSLGYAREFDSRRVTPRNNEMWTSRFNATVTTEGV